MELEFFCKPGTDLEWFDYWKEYSMSYRSLESADMYNIHVRTMKRRSCHTTAIRPPDPELSVPVGWGKNCGALQTELTA